jgi:two-component system sensor histidine kinase HydH
MAAHVAHEVRNNLVPVTLYLSLLRRRLAEDNASLEIFNKITAGCTALDATVNDLLHFTADRDPNCASVGVGPLVHDVLTALAPQLAAQKILVDTEIPANLAVIADQEMLRRVILNLTLNALDAMPGGGELTVSSDCSGDGWEITVADTGPGLSEDVLKRAFEPFFTTKNNGTGLGLAIVYRIAEVHGGQIVAANHSSGGAAFTFRIPQAAQSNAEQLSASQLQSSGQRRAA